MADSNTCPRRPRVAPFGVPACSRPRQTSCVGTLISSGKASGLLEPRSRSSSVAARRVRPDCASIRSRAVSGCNINDGPLLMCSTTASSPGRAVTRTVSLLPRSAPTCTRCMTLPHPPNAAGLPANAAPRVASGGATDWPRTTKVMALAEGTSFMGYLSARVQGLLPG